MLFLLWGQRRQCLPPIVTALPLVGICVTWTGVCLGRPYLLVILEGGFIDVSIGHQSVSYPFSIVLYFYVNLWISLVAHHIYGIHFVAVHRSVQEQMSSWSWNNPHCVRKVYKASIWGKGHKKWEGWCLCNGSRSTGVGNDSKTHGWKI